MYLFDMYMSKLRNELNLSMFILNMGGRVKSTLVIKYILSGGSRVFLGSYSFSMCDCWSQVHVLCFIVIT